MSTQKTTGVFNLSAWIILLIKKSLNVVSLTVCISAFPVTFKMDVEKEVFPFPVSSSYIHTIQRLAKLQSPRSLKNMHIVPLSSSDPTNTKE